ncbi:MAG: DUF2071 domain-containing protein [Planctomycetota bacterium]
MTENPIDPRTAGHQAWRDLAFVHWRVPVAALRPHVPAWLEVDTDAGDAWIGVVPFSMERVRPWWSPPVPGVSWFLETNVRTYVVDPRTGERGVWFFSLDATKRLAVRVARALWHLPYFRARLELAVEPGGARGADVRAVTYRGARVGDARAEYALRAELGDGPARPAPPDTLEHFLVERYLLFTEKRDGTRWRGRVHHEPYALRDVASCEVRQSLTGAAGVPIEPDRAPDHVAFSPGVDVRVAPLRRLPER